MIKLVCLAAFHGPDHHWRRHGRIRRHRGRVTQAAVILQARRLNAVAAAIWRGVRTVGERRRWAADGGDYAGIGDGATAGKR